MVLIFLYTKTGSNGRRKRLIAKVSPTGITAIYTGNDAANAAGSHTAMQIEVSASQINEICKAAHRAGIYPYSSYAE